MCVRRFINEVSKMMRKNYVVTLCLFCFSDTFDSGWSDSFSSFWYQWFETIITRRRELWKWRSLELSKFQVFLNPMCLQSIWSKLFSVKIKWFTVQITDLKLITFLTDSLSYTNKFSNNWQLLSALLCKYLCWIGRYKTVPQLTQFYD